LSCVADSSRPTPPNLPAPATALSPGHTCSSTRVFASGLLQADITAPPLPSATLRLHLAGSGLCVVYVALLQPHSTTQHHLAAGQARHTTISFSGAQKAAPAEEYVMHRELRDLLNKEMIYESQA